jgi:cytidylate kinase
MKKIIIAIDGHSACGKSTTAKAVAKKLGYSYIDSGAMYRAVTLYFTRHHITLTNPHEVDHALENIDIHFKIDSDGAPVTYLNGLNVEQEIREMEVTRQVSYVSALPAVRAALVKKQRKLGKEKAVVMDGRDIGSVVFPEAELKIFMTADFNVRAMRRQKELIEKGTTINLAVVKENLRQRDLLDSTREVSPLIQVPEAIIINNTFMTFEEQVEEIIQLATGKVLEEA